MKLITKVQKIFNEFGFTLGTLYLLNRILCYAPFDCRIVAYDIVVQPVPKDKLIASRHLKEIKYLSLDQESAHVKWMPVPSKIIDNRYKQNARCLGAFRAEQFIGYIWFVEDIYMEDEIRCQFKLPSTECVFDFDVYVFPEYRAGRAFITLWECANEEFRRTGIRFSYSRITKLNLSSRAAHRKLGAESVGWLYVVKLFRLEILMSSLRPYFAISVSEKSRPTLPLPYLTSS